MIGLGRLGTPVALAIAAAGHHVVGVDPDPNVWAALHRRQLRFHEPAAQALLDQGATIRQNSTAAVATFCDIAFVAVQTPHQPQYEGTTPLPDTRADFDYTYLTAAVRELAKAAADLRDPARGPLTIAVISTVLPGTVEREIKPLLGERCRLVYTPQFIAMGSTVEDFTNPEFVLLGVDDEDAASQVRCFYTSITPAPVHTMSVASAELAKVAYNTFITAKLTVVNLLAQIADATGADVDDVTGVLTAACRRIVSSAYMRAGMGDGGGCHPRDNIALSWLAREHGLPDLFSSLMAARERHCAWLAELALTAANEAGLPIVVLGRAYKAGTNLTVGSPATLLVNLLGGDVEQWDPHVDNTPPPDYQAVYVLATDHREFHGFYVAPGSVVVDPWGSFLDADGVTVIRPGRTRPPQPRWVSERGPELVSLRGR